MLRAQRVSDFFFGYLEPMTLEEVRAYVAAHPCVLGSMIHDCRGIIVSDEVIVFENPVQVRNHEAKETA